MGVCNSKEIEKKKRPDTIEELTAKWKSIDESGFKDKNLVFERYVRNKLFREDMSDIDNSVILDVEFPLKLDYLRMDFISTVIIENPYSYPLTLSFTDRATVFDSWEVNPGLNVIELNDGALSVIHARFEDYYLETSERISGKIRAGMFCRQNRRKHACSEHVYVSQDDEVFIAYAGKYIK